MINKKGGEVIEDLFQPLLSRYKIVLETFVKDSGFIIDKVHVLYCKGHKIIFKFGGWYIGSPDWINNKKAIMYPINK